jgi:hypothetical protein
MPTLSKTASMPAAPISVAKGRTFRRQGLGTRLVNAISMTLLVVLRLYMAAVAGVVACRAIGFW